MSEEKNDVKPKEEVKPDVKTFTQAEVDAARKEEKDKLYKEIGSLKDKVKDLNLSISSDSEDNKKLKEQMDKISKEYETKLTGFKTQSIELQIKSQLAKVKSETGMDVPIEFIGSYSNDLSEPDLKDLIAKAVSKTKTFLETNKSNKFKDVPKPENNQAEGGLVNLDTYTKASDLIKDAKKLIAKQEK